MGKTKRSLLALAIALAGVIVMDFEGYSKVGYSDPIGIPTAGVGHTGPDVAVGRVYSDATIKEWLTGDLSYAAAIVDRCAAVPMNPHVRAAMVSFTFNVGPGKRGVKDGFCILKSGKVPRHLRHLRVGNTYGACNALLAWNKAGGKVLKGLTRRRVAERNLCLKPWKDDNV